MLKLLVICFGLSTSMLSAITLEEAVENGVSVNPEIREKTSRYNEIYYDKEIAKAGFLPKVTLNGNLRLDDSRKQFYGDRAYDMEIGVKENLFNGFGDVNRYNLERMKYESAYYSTQELVNAFSYEVIKTYLELLRNRELYAIEQASVQNREEILKKIQRKYDIGLGNKLELSLSETSLALAKINLHEQENGLRQAMINFQKYVTLPVEPSELKEPLEGIRIPDTVDEALQRAFSGHPSMKVAQLNLAMTN